MTTAEIAIVLRAQDRASGPLRKLKANVASVSKSVSSMNKSASRLGTLTLAGAGGLASAALATGVNFNILKQNATLAFTTLLKDGGKAQAMISQIEETAKKTPFGFEDLTRAAQRMLAFGFAGEDVIPMLTTIGDAVSAMGGGAAMIDRVTMALGQMQTKGKVSGEEMMQLAEAGIPAWQILAENVGEISPRLAEAVKAGKMTQQQVINSLQKMAEAGKLKSGPAIAALRKGMASRFGGLGEAQSKTTGGATSALSDALQQLFGALSEGPLKTITGWMITLAEEIPKITKGFKDLSDPVKTVIGWFATISAAVLGSAGLLAIIGFLTGSGGLGGLIGTFATVARIVAGPVLTALGLIGWPLTLILIAVTALYLAWTNNWFGIRDKTAAVLDWLRTKLADLGDWMGSVWATIKKVWSGGMTAVGFYVENGWAYVLGYFQWFKNRAVDVIDTAVGLVILAWQWLSDETIRVVSSAWSKAVEWFQWLSDEGTRIVSTGWTTVVEWFQWVSDAAVAILNPGWTSVVAWFQWLADAATQIVSVAWTTVVGLFQSLTDRVTAVIGPGLTTVKDWFVWGVNEAIRLVSTGWTIVVDWFGYLGRRAIEVVGGAWTRVMEWFHWLSDNGAAAIQWLVDRIESLFNGLGDRIRGIWQPIVDLIEKAKKIGAGATGSGGSGGGSVSIVGTNIPFAAAGGIVTSPTLAMIGESGPEAIVPLGGRGGMGGSLVIQINAPVYGVNQLEDVIRRAIDRSRQRGGVA